MNASVLILAASAALLAAPAVAQQDDHGQKPHYVKLGDVLGADVRMLPSAEDVREAAKDNERPDRPTGEVSDLLVHPQTGDIRWAVVSCGGFLGIGDKNVAVPISNLRWNEDKDCFDLSATVAELEALPEFDMAEAKRVGLDRSIGVVEASWARVSDNFEPEEREDTKADAQVVTYESMAVRIEPARFFAASDLDDYPVFARGSKFGDVSKGIVNLSDNKIAYAIVSRGGLAGIGDELYLLPFSALRMCSVVDDEGKTIFCVDRSEDMMKGCVKYEKPEKGVLSHELARRADEKFSS